MCKINTNLIYHNSHIFESLAMRVEIENEMSVFLESLDFEIEMTVSQITGMLNR